MLLSTYPGVVDPNLPDQIYAKSGAGTGEGNPVTFILNPPAPAGNGPPPGTYWTYFKCVDGPWLWRGPQWTVYAAGTFTPPPTSTVVGSPPKTGEDWSWLGMVGLAAWFGALAMWRRSGPRTP